MTKQQFEAIFERLTDRRRQVLLKLLANESDEAIANSLHITKETVRKHIQKICERFGLSNDFLNKHRSKRQDLVALFTKYKPELVIGYPQDNQEKDHSKLVSAVGELVNDGLDRYCSGNYYKVIKYYQHLLIIAKTHRDIQGEVASLTHIGNSYYCLGNWEKALEFYQESLVKLKTTCVPNLEGIILGSMGNVYFACVDYKQAINFYKKALKFWQLNHNLQSEAHVLDKLEKAYRASKQYDKAIERNQRYLAILRDRIPSPQSQKRKS
jgi:tetratricopeptide (TPR) repeat protein